ncbi:MAG: tetratricopeptide repeat protein [Acidobacteria bacterium]|nr:tetratricopeptide repeat protein [Acidobacteriota bacterium]MBV8894759.1 tetratricopeptide repeat protein [Acidobacteriota bacterium]MBV9482669.1 tetratricopeptide repeat protein [Acidobacteriota bacterium]
MNTNRVTARIALFAALCLAVPSAWGVSKEIVQLQTQVQALQDQMARMQQSFDERMGVMKNLVEQDTDTANKLANAIQALQTSLQKQQADVGGRTDQVSGQIQSLNDSMDELKARLTKLSQQLDTLAQTQQSLTQQQQAVQQQAQAPPPDVLYNNALRDYNAGNAQVATQEFNDYIKYYPNTDLAGNAFFYLAELAYRQGDFQQAVKFYDQVLQNFPSGSKAAAAELKKGAALIQLGQKDDGIKELRHVIQRYPRSQEATQAREQLRKLGVSSKPAGGD